jgi:hypothetical protein
LSVKILHVKASLPKELRSVVSVDGVRQAVTGRSLREDGLLIALSNRAANAVCCDRHRVSEQPGMMWTVPEFPPLCVIFWSSNRRIADDVPAAVESSDNQLAS